MGPAATGRLLASLGVRPSRKLGQNFLINRRAAGRIVGLASLSRKDTALEVGPGTGALTEYICASAGRVLAVEADGRLAAYLQERYAEEGRLELYHADIMSFDISGRASDKLKVIGAIPYSITSPLITRLIENRKHISRAVLVVQHEVADRICAAPGSRIYGAFSCFVQFHCVCACLDRISRRSFFPQPAVDSRVLALEMRNTPPVRVRDEAVFFALIRAGFNWRRKTLVNCVLASMGSRIERPEAEAAFLRAALPPGIRAEQLSLEDFARLADELSMVR